MSDAEIERQVQAAIRDYAKSKDRMIHLKKKIEDFRSACTKANNAMAPGAIWALEGKPESEFSGLLSPAEAAKLVADYFATQGTIQSLGEYLRKVGYAGLVAE